MLDQGWFSLNGTRKYPIDDAATAIADNGQFLPNDFLLDCSLRFPRAVGQYVYISSARITENLYSLTFLASDTPAAGSDCDNVPSSNAGSFTPLASVTVRRSELVEFQQYPVKPLYPGVGGWVVFGDVRSVTSFNGLFSDPAQSMLLPRCCRGYDALPIPNVATLHNAQTLTGIVQLVAGADVDINYDERLIAGITRNCIVIALKNSPGRDVLDLYRGQCSGRPESNTCTQPVIESINGIEPDCRGNIDIEIVSDCVDVLALHNDIVVDYCFPLEDACTKDNGLPKNGRLPNDYDDYCDPNQWNSESLGDDLYYIYGAEDTQWVTQSSSSIVTEYYCDFSAETPPFTVQRGTFTYLNGAYSALRTGRRTLALWDVGTNDALLYDQVLTNLTITRATAKGIGGLVLNWDESDNGYYTAMLDKRTGRFGFWSFLGNRFVPVETVTLPIQYDAVYTLIVSVTADSDESLTLTASLLSGDVVLARVSTNVVRESFLHRQLGFIAIAGNLNFLDFRIGVEPAFSASLISESGSPAESSSQSPTVPMLSWLFTMGDGTPTHGDLVLTGTAIGSDVAGPRELATLDCTDDRYLSSEPTGLLGESFTSALWLRVSDTPTAAATIWGKFTDTAPEWLLWFDENQIAFVVYMPDGRAVAVWPTLPGGTLAVDEWHHVVVWWNDTTREMGIEIDGEYMRTRGLAEDRLASDAPLHLRRPAYEWMLGQADLTIAEVLCYDSVLTAEDRYRLYTDGPDA